MKEEKKQIPLTEWIRKIDVPGRATCVSCIKIIVIVTSYIVPIVVLALLIFFYFNYYFILLKFVEILNFLNCIFLKLTPF